MGDMEIALKIWERAGIGLVILLGLGFFIVKYAWPWFTARDRDTLKMFRDQGKEFTEALKRRDGEFGKLVTVIERAEARRQAREDRAEAPDEEPDPKVKTRRRSKQ